MRRHLLPALFLALALPSLVAQAPSAALHHLADRFVDQQLALDPTLALRSGLPNPNPADDARLPDRSPARLAAFARAEQADLAALHAIRPATLSLPDHATFAVLQEQLEADLQLRVCRQELWAVDHFQGWQAELPEVAANQPIATPQQQQDALARWSALPTFVETQSSNLRLGLSLGYSAPQSVVRRVLLQLDALTPTDPARSPFASPATRSTDPVFRAAFLHVVSTAIYPALRQFQSFLLTVYLPRARTGIAISDLPHGPACYQAFLRANTTLNRTPRQVFTLGQQTVAANLVVVQQLGTQHFGTAAIPAILAAIRSEPSEQLHSADDLLTVSRQTLDRARSITAAQLIDHLPAERVRIEPLSAVDGAGGGNSRFIPGATPADPSRFVLQLSAWQHETRAEAQIVTAHETIPGHFLQKAVARELQSPTRLSHLTDFPAYAEGWARYAELMAEQAGIFTAPEPTRAGQDSTGESNVPPPAVNTSRTTPEPLLSPGTGIGTVSSATLDPDAAILRRLWPARGMVLDPGLHAFGWSRQQAIAYILASGRETPSSANDLVDRIAVMPGQLTSYDSGGLEILALRHHAEAVLGPRFRLQQFNRVLLDEGSVPLPELRAHVRNWFGTETRTPASPTPRRP